jgi:hypothetical protein
MKRAVIYRLLGTEHQSLGVLSTVNNGQLFIAKTLELPDKANQQKISCIPAGVYRCVWSFSNAFQKHTYEILDVPNRAGIRIHSANYFSQLLGCVALGNALKDINNDGHQDIIHSGNTMEEFEKAMNYEQFELEIVDNTAALAA